MLHKMDVLRIFYNGNLGSYYKFLVKYEPEYRIRVGEDEEKVIEFVSKKLANGKRIHELRLLKRMLTYTQGVALFHGLQTDLDHDYGIHMNQNQMENIVNVMTNKFPSGGNRGLRRVCFLGKGQGKRARLSDRKVVCEDAGKRGVSRYFKGACGIWNQPLRKRFFEHLSEYELCFVSKVYL